MKRFNMLFLLLYLLIVPVFIKAEGSYIYDAFKDDKNSEIVKEYDREHQDTVNGTGKDKIYYFNAESNEEVNQIINKRNVIFGGFCWEMFRTTDSGGVKLLYNGVVTDGKCYGNGSSIGSSEYTIYDNLYSLGSVGYMYNKLYPGFEYVTPTYGSYVVKGQKLPEDDYNVIKITKYQDQYPSNGSYYYRDSFKYTSNGWQNDKNSNGYARDGTITFNVLNDGDYVLDYFFDYDYYSDRVEVYVNDSHEGSIVRQEKGVVILNDLSKDDVIKVTLDLMGSDNKTDFYFNMKIPTDDPVDTRAYFGNSVKYSNGKYTLVDTIRSDGTNDLAYNHYFCKDGTMSCTDVYYTMGWYYPTQMQSFKLSNGMTIEEFVNDQLYADDVNKYDSALKATIDNWYKNNLIDYSKYLEDTVFCQNRNFASKENALNPNGGNPGGGSRRTYFFKHSYSDNDFEEKYLYNSNLKCDNITDMYSTSNPKAKLKYSVATINYAEALLLFNRDYDTGGNYGAKVRAHNIDYSYWLLSPHDIAVTYGWSVSRDGGIYYSYGSNKNGVRPVVSLRKGTKYYQGDGSRDNPYVIMDYGYNDILLKNEDTSGTFNFNIEKLNDVMETTRVTFTVEPINGYVLSAIKIIDENGEELDYSWSEADGNYTFIMPNIDVIIIPTYTKEVTSPKKEIVNIIEKIKNPNTVDRIVILFIILGTSLGLAIYLNKKKGYHI